MTPRTWTALPWLRESDSAFSPDSHLWNKTKRNNTSKGFRSEAHKHHPDGREAGGAAACWVSLYPLACKLNISGPDTTTAVKVRNKGRPARRGRHNTANVAYGERALMLKRVACQETAGHHPFLKLIDGAAFLTCISDNDGDHDDTRRKGSSYLRLSLILVIRLTWSCTCVLILFRAFRISRLSLIWATWVCSCTRNGHR